MKKTVLIITVLFGAGLLLTITLFSFFSANRLKSQLGQAQNMIQKTQEEMARLEQDKEKIDQDNEKLQQDAVSYVALNSKLQDEREKLQKDLEEAEKTIETREAVLERQRIKLQELERKIAKDKTGQRGEAFKTREELQNKIASLEDTLNKERALYHYNLAVAYSQAGLYDQAIESYEKSLFSDSRNADAHYNLGLLYHNINQDRARAVEHYRRYLELKPDAEDKEEVLGWIENLERG